MPRISQISTEIKKLKSVESVALFIFESSPSCAYAFTGFGAPGDALKTLLATDDWPLVTVFSEQIIKARSSCRRS
jgi:hypothetical protein